MTFRSRVVLGYSVMSTATVVVLLFTLRILLEKHSLKQLDRQHAEEAAELLRAVPAQRGAPVPRGEARERGWIDHLRVAEGASLFSLETDDGRTVFRSDELAEDGFFTQPAGLAQDFQHLGECWITVHRLDGYTLRIVTPVKETLKVVRHFEHIAGIVLVATLLVGILSGFLYSRWLVRPLARLEEAAADIDAGVADRIPAALATTRDEIGDIARRLNAGYERIGASIDRVRLFSAEVSHELRTPLSILRLNAERIAGRDNLDPAVREMVAEQLEEVGRMNGFIANLLAFARLESGALTLDRRPVDFRQWIADFSEDAAALAEDSGCRFELGEGCACLVTMDPVWMRQVLFNLLRNALRYSPKGGLVRLVTETCDNTGVTLVLEDEGPGVPPEKLESIFERYMRFEERLHPGEGFGLGLAISRVVITLHGGKIFAENRADRSGLRVVIRLPGG